MIKQKGTKGDTSQLHLKNLFCLRCNLDVSQKHKTKGSKTSISHFYDKLLKIKDLMNTDTAKIIAKERHKYLEDFLQEFFDEWNGKNDRYRLFIFKR